MPRLIRKPRAPLSDPAIWIVIPAYNESTVIADVVAEVRAAGYDNIIVVDDGSSDDTQTRAHKAGITALRHKINRGKGAATKTGIEAAKIQSADIIVTLDGDGQHDPADIAALVEPIAAGKVHVALGSRFLGSLDGMPTHKILCNKLGNAITWYLFGLWVTDSQSGMRAYSRRAADLIDTRYDRYEYESEVIHEINHHHLAFAEVPITIRYTDYSMNKGHGQSLTNGVLTVYKMLFRLFH